MTGKYYEKLFAYNALRAWFVLSFLLGVDPDFTEMEDGAKYFIVRKRT